MPEKENVIAAKSFAFALRIVACCRFLQHTEKEFVLSKQLLRSGTSIGANVEEAVGGFSRKDFIHKMQIAYKEARETKYWLRLLVSAGMIPDAVLEEKGESLFELTDELLRILGSILKSSKAGQDAPILHS